MLTARLSTTLTIFYYQIGAVRYNRDIDPLWELRQFNTSTEILQAIDQIPYNGSGTLTGQALNYARETMLTAEAGARDGVTKIVVLITDG